tara:strand:+ start:233 stop:685 length:453 start_codon:yes stop_codon:yes gene_type:complete
MRIDLTSVECQEIIDQLFEGGGYIPNDDKGTTIPCDDCECVATDDCAYKYDEKEVALERKATPVFSGVLKYFPDALKEVAKCSNAGQQQHNPNQPLHWDRSKSKDELDALTRHLIDHGVDPVDTDGVLHLAKVAWRSLAALQKYLEGENI